MVKCLDCGEVFQESSLIQESWDEPRGEYWGMPCSERMTEYHCPWCNSTDVEDYYEEEEE